MKRILIPIFAVMLSCNYMSAQSHVLDVQTSKIGGAIDNTMYGIFFEDINYAADGGLYGELVKNRSFEFPQHLMGWKTFGNVLVKDDGPFKKCPHYVQLSWPNHQERRTGLQNEGYFGIGVLKDADYHFSVWAKAPSGKASIRVQLIDESSASEHQEFVEDKINVTSSEWKKYEITLHSTKTDNHANLRIFLVGNDTVDLEHISLFPADTYKGRQNGMRKDLAQALEDEHPGVLRFPGGCIVEGVDLATRYQWKNTIGPVENRPLNENRWEYTFDYRFFPDYYQSYGLGFFEFFQLAEDIGAEPLPVLNVGMACQFQNGTDPDAYVPCDQLKPYIQDCLDLIEFANGDTTTTWGKKRAEMGHPQPFNLKMIAVGNEQWDTLYYKRLNPFVTALRKAYPKIKIVGTSGPSPDGNEYNKGWAAMRQLKADLVDEHFYEPDEWFLSHGLRYENYSRKGPKVFAGEYSCHSHGKKYNHYEAALYEAAFMTDYERNADVVKITAYAPLFAHIDGWQWRPNLIWYDNTRMFKSCSYYVQQMYATNKGTNMLALTMNGKPVAGQQGQGGLFASACFDKPSSTVIIKVINTSNQAQEVSINLQGLKGERSVVTSTFSSNDMDAENTLDNPEKIIPQTGAATAQMSGKSSMIKDTISAKTFRIYKIKK
jgi:alpha-N-arabinofuranosidase